MKGKSSLAWRVILTAIMALVLALSFALPAGSTVSGVCVNIIECPGCTDCAECPQIIEPCTDFGVKATVTNNTGGIAHDVIAYIEVASGPASLIEGMPSSWELGNLDVDETVTVAWTLHCDDPGDANVVVTTNYTTSLSCTRDNCVVEQEWPPELEVDMSGPCEICTECDEDEFQICADVWNNGDVDATNVNAVISMEPTGLAQISPPSSKFIGEITAGNYETVCWDVVCLGPGDVEFTVTATGQNACTMEELEPDEDMYTVRQRDATVDVCVVGVGSEVNPDYGDPQVPKYSPACDDCCTDMDIVSTLQKFAATATVTNCSGENMPMDITLTVPPGTELSMEDKVEIWCEGTTSWSLKDPAETIHLNNVCACCDMEITWYLKCVESTDGIWEPIIVTAESEGEWLDDNMDCQPAWVLQEAKVHLATELEAYTFDCTGCGGGCMVEAVAVGQEFDVKVKVTNEGEADAKAVYMDIRVQGPTDCDDFYENLEFGDIPGGYTVWHWLSDMTESSICTCTGEGEVRVNIERIGCDTGGDSCVEGTGIDENTCEPILEDNIEAICPLIIDQVPVEVVIINPLYCEDINVCSSFAVKARISNYSTTEPLYNVAATLNWTGNAELHADSPKTQVIDLIPCDMCEEGPSEYEVTWMMRCTAPGNVVLHVCAEGGDPHFKVQDIYYPEWHDQGESPYWPITIHQIPPDPADISVEIISPDAHDTFIATSQEFAVTTVIANNEPYATVTIEDMELMWHPESAASCLAMPEESFDIGPGETHAVTWTMQCEESGLLLLKASAWGYTDICQEAWGCSMPIIVWQYPTAHLEVEILDVIPDTSIEVCDEFEVHYRVTNTGEADATEIETFLSVTPEGTVRPAEGDNGYSQYVGTLPGHGQDGSYEGIWNLHCKAACESTLNITAAGYDEYGYHKKQECQSTGSFMVEAGCFYLEELETVEPPPIPDFGVLGVPNKGWTYGVLVGEANGLIGPFNIDTPVSWAGMGGGPDFTGNLVAMGATITDFGPHAECLLDMLPGLNLADIMEMMNMEGVDHDVIIFIGHIIMDSEWDYIGGPECYSVMGGMFQTINGQMTGAQIAFDGDCGVFSFLGGTYCSTMAAEALREIDAKFIEDATVTIKQHLPADIAVTKSVDNDRPMMGEQVVFTITATNNGPGIATGLEIEDILDEDLDLMDAMASKGSYSAGVWNIGKLDVGATAMLEIVVDVECEDEILNMAEVCNMDQNDWNSFNNADYAMLNQAAVESMPINLGDGWNLISMPLIPNDTNIDTVLAGIKANVDPGYGIWTYDAATTAWSSSVPNASPPPEWLGSLTMVKDGPGYWLVMSNPDTLTVDGVEIMLPPMTPPTYNTVEGWNLIGFKSISPKKAGEYLAAIDGKYTMIYRFTNGVYSAVQAGDNMVPGQGYWIAITAPGTIYP